MAELYAKAWDNPTAHNSLEPGDLILKVEIPVSNRAAPTCRSARRQYFDWALVSCAAAAKVDGKKLSQVKIVLGAVSPVPYQVEGGERFSGRQNSGRCHRKQSRRSDSGKGQAHVFEHNGYKMPIMRALVRRTLMQLIA